MLPSTLELHHVTYLGTKFEVAMSCGLGGDTFTRNVTAARTHRRTEGRRTDFGTKLLKPFFLKKKAGIIMADSAYFMISTSQRLLILCRCYKHIEDLHVEV